MGTEITEEDLENIQNLAEQVVQFSDYRTQLASYLSARMSAIAPNLTALVGELVGARLIAHAGSLMNLSKSPASTIQILGAEKALFRALKTKHDTPKYGLIYHASLVGQASGKNKGKMARVLAAKAALGLRVDALQDWGENEADILEDEKAALGREARANLERKLAGMEGKPIKPRGVGIGPNGTSTTPQPKKWEIKEARKYNPDADGLSGDEAPAKKEKKAKKEKLIEEIKDVKMENGGDDDDDSEAESQPDEPIDAAEAAAIVPNGINGTSVAKKAEKDRKKAARKSNQGTTAEPSTEERAEQCGLSVERYKRKLERGEIEWVDGKPVAISKKDKKKEKKAAQKQAATQANGETDSSKKRKRTEEEAEPSKSEKKKKRKDKA
jgi:nucleolar protein 58